MKELLILLINKLKTISDPIKATMDFNSNHTGIAIGKTSERDGLEVDWDAQFNGKLNVKDVVNGTIACQGIDGDLLVFALNCKNGFTPFLTGSGTTNLPNAGSYGYSVGAVYKRTSDQCTVMLFDYARNTFAMNTYTISSWIGWSILSDYIVEQGISGIWTYRKWNSGVSECWGRQDDLQITDGYAMFDSFPSGLFINNNAECVNASAWYGISNDRMARRLHITATTQNYVYLRNYDGSLPTGTFAVMIEAKGRWK